MFVYGEIMKKWLKFFCCCCKKDDDDQEDYRRDHYSKASDRTYGARAGMFGRAVDSHDVTINIYNEEHRKNVRYTHSD